MTAADKIATLLAQGPHTAKELGRVLVLGHCDVYAALIGMEARGEAIMRPAADGKGQAWEPGRAAPVLTVDEALSALEAEIGGAK